MKFHAVTRILSAIAPTLKYLQIVYAPSRKFLLPHVNLPQLVDLVIQGSYEGWVQPRPGATPMFKKLRRLRLTEVNTSRGGGMFQTVAASAPNLIHLRLDHRYPYYLDICSELQEFLGHVSQKPDAETSKSPFSLEKLFLHPGMRSSPRNMCGTSYMFHSFSMKALRTLADTDPRFILLKEDENARRSKYEVDEGLTAWLGEINGQPSHWEEPTI